MLELIVYALLWFAVIGSIIGGIWRHLKTDYTPGPLPYKQRDWFLSAGELRFFHALRHANQDRFEIVVKPRIADLLETTRHDYRAFSRISQNHVDFVLCDRKTMRPVLVVELDDRSHERPDRIARDQFVDAAMQSARLRILHVPVTRDYGDLEEMLRRAVDRSNI